MDYPAFNMTPFKSSYWSPWPSTSHLRSDGLPWGIDMRTNQTFELDPWRAKYRDRNHPKRPPSETPSLVLHMYGDKERGKTSAGRAAVMRWGSLGAGRDHARTWINGSAINEGEEEYSSLALELESHQIRVRDHRINLFDYKMRFTPSQLYEVAFNFTEMGADRKLGSLPGPAVDEPLALQIAMFRMTRDHDEKAWCPGLLRAIVGRLDEDDIRAYFDDTDNQLRDSFDTLINRAKTDEEVEDAERHRRQLQVVLNKPLNLDTRSLVRAGGLISQHWLEILHGKYGGIVSVGPDGYSFYDDMRQDAVALDWAGLNERQFTAVRTYLTFAETAAMIRGDNDFIPHIQLTDEEHESLKNLAYARAVSEKIKKIRKMHTLLIGMSQYPSDYLRVGDAGSEQRALATGMMLGVDMAMVFRVRSEEIPVLRERWNFSRNDGEYIKRLPTGCCMLFVGERRPIPIMLVLTPYELELSRSNQGTDRMIEERLAVWDVPGYSIRYGGRVHKLSRGVSRVEA